MKYEEKVVRKIEEYNGGIRLICDTNYALGTKAQAALDLSKRMAMAMIEFVGENSLGEQKRRLMHPETVATRACDIIEYLFREFDRREWLLEVPEPSEPQD